MKSSIDRLKEYQIKSGYTPFQMDQIEHIISRVLPSFLSSKEKEYYKNSMLEEFRNMLEQRPTEYQNPSTYSLLRGLFLRIESSAIKLSKDNDFTFPQKLTYGTASIQAFTAFVNDSNQSKDYLMLISDEMFTFANLLAKSIGNLTISSSSTPEAWAYCFQETHIAQALRNNHDTVLRFADLILAYAITNCASQAQQYNLNSQEQIAITNLIRDSFELFVVGHEYSHLLLGHLQGDHDTSSEKHYVQLNDEKIELIITNWSQEVNADILAAHLAIIAQKGYDFASAYVGVDYCLIALIILERLETHLKGNRIVPVTHPSAEIRREMVFDELVKIEPNIGGLYKSNTFIIDELWNRCMYLVQQLNKMTDQLLHLPLTRVPYRFTQNILYRIGDVMLTEYDKEHT